MEQQLMEQTPKAVQIVKSQVFEPSLSISLDVRDTMFLIVRFIQDGGAKMIGGR